MNWKKVAKLIAILVIIGSFSWAYQDAVQTATNYSYAPAINPGGEEVKINILDSLKFFTQTTLARFPCPLKYLEWKIDKHINHLQYCWAIKPSVVPDSVNSNFYKIKKIKEIQLNIPRGQLVASAQINPKKVLLVSRTGELFSYSLTSNKVIHNFSLKTIDKADVHGFLQGPLKGVNELNGLGIRDIALSEDKKAVFISSLQANANSCAVMNLYKGVFNEHNSKVKIIKVKKIFSTEKECARLSGAHLNGAGGKILSVDNKSVLFTLGDMNLIDRRLNNSYWGKTYLINTTNSEYREFTIGHRNPSGITKIKNTIYEVEQGPQGGDEINLLKNGFDFGWPFSSYGKNYSSDISSGQYKTGENNHKYGVKPLLAFVPSPAFSDIGVFESNAPEYWKNSEGHSDLFISSLKASSIYRCRVDGGYIAYCEKIFLRERLRDILPINFKNQFNLILLSDNSTLIHLQVTDIR